MSESAEFEALLRRALAPIEPPEDLSERLESTLMTISQLAAGELDAWEIGAMRDPRNWVRPAAAAVVGTAAGTALVLLRARRRAARRRRPENALDAAERALRDVFGEARKLLEGDLRR
jgi:hypothetical protein